MKRYDVCLSVHLSVPAWATGLLLWARQTGDIDRVVAAARGGRMQAVPRCHCT